jgi:hypothetical protein
LKINVYTKFINGSKKKHAMKHILLILIHWAIIIALIISSIIFIFDEAELSRSNAEIKDGKLMFCTTDGCVSYTTKISWTFLKIFIFEIIVAILALIALREGISLEKRFKSQKID